MTTYDKGKMLDSARLCVTLSPWIRDESDTVMKVIFQDYANVAPDNIEICLADIDECTASLIRNCESIIKSATYIREQLDM